MFQESFLDFIDRGVASGQRTLADSVRSLLCACAPELFEALDLQDDALFLEPLLFAWLSAPAPAVPLEQLLFGYLADDAKPSSVEVRCDRAGVAFLPRLGEVATGLPGAALRLDWDAARREFVFSSHGTAVRAAPERLHTVAGGRVEVFRRENPLLGRLFVDEQGDAGEVEVDGIARAQLANLAAGFGLLARCHPRYSRNVLDVTRRVMIFSSPGLNSFAAMSAHGVAFLNTAPEASPVFFLEDLAHQCGHLVFGAMTLETGEYLKVPAETPLQHFTGVPGERRTVYETFHGVFTEAVMFQCLDACWEGGCQTGAGAHELRGRMAAVLRRFGGDLRSLARPGVFTEAGEWVFQNLVEAFNDAGEKRWEMLRGLDLSNQPYNFSYACFAELNPLSDDADEPGVEELSAILAEPCEHAEGTEEERAATSQPA
ncbi:MAG TPA: hypothetical protein VF771_00165 [Longimicrobiaceae bacterium]